MKDLKFYSKVQEKETLEKLKYGNFDIYCNIVVIMVAPAIFQGIVLPSAAVAANQGKHAQTFVDVTQKCVKTLIR